MKHALIIASDGEISRVIEDRLAHVGFNSFEHVWSEEAAVEIAARRPPDLVVIGETLDAGCPYSAARRICAVRDIPALVAARRGEVRTAPPADASLSGPFMLREIGRAVAEAEHPTTRTAAA